MPRRRLVASLLRIARIRRDKAINRIDLELITTQGAWAARPAMGRFLRIWNEAATPDAWVAPTGLDDDGFSHSFTTTQTTNQQCATCHSRREAHDDKSPLPDAPFQDAYGLALLQNGLYHADGQILDEAFA